MAITMKSQGFDIFDSPFKLSIKYTTIIIQLFLKYNEKRKHLAFFQYNNYSSVITSFKLLSSFFFPMISKKQE